jgi:glycosyltransferase involved in cell wall biosynthesis
MAKVLLIGATPPQLLTGGKIEASHYRTWQFLQPLIDAGHQAALCAGEPPGSHRPHSIDADVAFPGLVAFQPIAFGERGWVATLQKMHDVFQPDCVVAVNFFPSLHATKLKTDRPLWMDIYGDQITIQQSFCHRLGSDRGLPTTIRFMRQVLQAGDIFSACGEVQKHMLVGELAMCGRLNRCSFGYEFVRVVLPGTPRATAASDSAGDRDATRARLGLGPNDFAMLWCGGYNTWTDVETLFNGVDLAMARHTGVHYVSVGASTYDAPDNMYERLLRMIGRSPHAARWHMLGWRPWTEVAQYYTACDVGLNIDAMHYETLYGTRTRLVEMMAAGLPVVTTEGTELSALIRQCGVGVTFPVGDHTQMARQLVTLAEDPAALARMATGTRRTARTRFSFDETTAPLRDWVRTPARAPDREAHLRTAGIAAKHRLRALVRHVTWQVTGRDR